MSADSGAPGRGVGETPRDSVAKAWRVALDPDEYNKITRRQLLGRGYSHYTDGSSLDEVSLIEDVSQFILDSLDIKENHKNVSDITGTPSEFVDEPGRLTLIATLASVLVKRHPVIKEDSREPIIHEVIKNHFFYHIKSARQFSTEKKTIQVTLGKVAYERNEEDDYGPPAGKVIEGIVQRDYGRADYYFKVPLVHANSNCEARIGNGRDGPMQCFIDGAYVYVPVTDAEAKYRREFHGSYGIAATHERTLTKNRTEETLDEWRKALSGVNRRISELVETGNEDSVFKERQYPADLKAILEAIENVDTDVAKLGDEETAKAIHNATQRYAKETERDWVDSVLTAIETPKQMGRKLSEYADNPEYPNISKNTYDGKANQYVLQYKKGSYQQIDVDGIEDLMEFPCMENLHESLMEKKPVRWELYSFVRYLFELKEADITVEDIHEWFSQYPWYKEDVTDYQANYERKQTMSDGNRPLPISCNNDHRRWAAHCIGKEHCEYSLYRSVELKDDVYERVGRGG